jgi:hypothetical protein
MEQAYLGTVVPRKKKEENSFDNKGPQLPDPGNTKREIDPNIIQKGLKSLENPVLRDSFT